MRIDKILLLTACSLMLHIFAYGQKPVIDTGSFDNWQDISQASISVDGKYIIYFDVLSRSQKGGDVVIRSAGSEKRFSISRVRDYKLVNGGRMVAFIRSPDSLCLSTIGSREIKYIGKANRFEIVGPESNEFLIYTMGGDISGGQILAIRDIANQKEVYLDSIIEHRASNTCGKIVLKKMSHRDSKKFVWELYDLNAGQTDTFWEGDPMVMQALDASGDHIAFITNRGDSDKGYDLWCYDARTRLMTKCVFNNSGQEFKGLDLSTDILTFSRDGKYVFCNMKSLHTPAKTDDGPQVDVWSYRDSVLKEQQVYDRNNETNVIACMNVASGRLSTVERDGYKSSMSYDLANDRDFVMLSKGYGDDNWWRGNDRASVSLMKLGDSLHESGIATDAGWKGDNWYWISPERRFLLYFKQAEKRFFIYNVHKNSTSELPVPADIVSGKFEIKGWLAGDSGIVVYDKWDIWLIDPDGRRSASCLTNQFGRDHHIQLRLTPLNVSNNSVVSLPHRHSIVLSAFDTVTKYSGYYSLDLGHMSSLGLLSMGPYTYRSIQKASTADAWLVLRESAEDAPNYFFTRDFEKFQRITDLMPEKKFNWLKAELVSWNLPSGRTEQGMLFRPENFDRNKKYPIIVYYYDALSDALYTYRAPGLTRDAINLPYFVSRGYVVFVPDIHYQFGHVGENALESVLSGTRFICRQPWADSTKIGLQGHSFGGYETNYIITHCNLFAAAEEGAGMSDLVSAYNGLSGYGSSNQDIFEAGQVRMGASLWQDRDRYINGAPIYNADKVTTPLLMMHNKQDNIVNWLQGVEFFSALRRCGKKAWMLQYDRGAHSVQNPEDALDYTIRIEQFFDHYLKGAPPPKWMTEGVPSRLKGIYNGYELDKGAEIP